MLCPYCKKKNTSLISSKPVVGKSSIVRKRHCVCGYLFETVEFPKKIFKKRKIDKRTEWANMRFKIYVQLRFITVAKEASKFISNNVLAQSLQAVKRKGKTKLLVKRIKNNKVINDELSFTPRTKTIDEILNMSSYWKDKFVRFNSNHKKADFDKFLDRMMKDKKVEKRNYERSIINHLIKKDKYNNKDFMISCFDNLGDHPNFKTASEAFKDDKFWKAWQIFL